MKMPSFSSLFLKKAKSIFSVVGIITILSGLVPVTAFAVPIPLTDSQDGHIVTMIPDNPNDVQITYNFGGQVPEGFRNDQQGGVLNLSNYGVQRNGQGDPVFPVSATFLPDSNFSIVNLDYNEAFAICSSTYAMSTSFGVPRNFSITRQCELGPDPAPAGPTACAELVSGDSNTDINLWMVAGGAQCDAQKISIDDLTNPDDLQSPSFWDFVLSDPTKFSSVNPNPGPVVNPNSNTPSNDRLVTRLSFSNPVSGGSTLYFDIGSPEWSQISVQAAGGAPGPGGNPGPNQACFGFMTENECSSPDNEPACEWQLAPGGGAGGYCSPMDPCKQYAEQVTCESPDNTPACKWQSGGAPGQFVCMMDMKSNYPTIDGSPIDEIFTFPQPFDNDGNALSDGNPYELDNRPSNMMEQVPRRWASGSAPTIIGFPEVYPSSDQIGSLDDYIKIYKRDGDSWVDMTTNFNLSFNFGDEFSQDRVEVTTINDLQSYTIYRIAVKGLMKEAGEVDVLYAGQTNECPDGSGDLCFTSTFSTGSSVTPSFGYQGGSGNVTSGCGPGTDFAVEWPFDGATNVQLDSVMRILDCNGSGQVPNLASGDIVLQQNGEPNVEVSTKDFVDPAGNLMMKPELPLNKNASYSLMQEDVSLSDFTTGTAFMNQNMQPGPGGGSGGMMTFGNGTLTINLKNSEGEVYTVSGNPLPINVQCGNLPTMQPSGPEGPMGSPVSDMFVMDANINPGQSSVTVNGIPTPSNGEGFTNNPCIVTLRPDAQGVTMGDEFSYTGGLNSEAHPSPVDFVEYFVNDDFSMPMPPMHKYAKVWFGNAGDGNPNEASLNLKLETLNPGTLSGVVCLNTYTGEGDGGSEACDEGDTLLSDVEVNAFPTAPMGNFGGVPMVVTDENGEFSFSGNLVGNYMVEVRNKPFSGQGFNYITNVVVNGNTSTNIVVDPGLSLNVTLDNTSQCWDQPGDPLNPAVHFNFLPNNFGFNKTPVFGSKSMSEIIDNQDGTYSMTLSGFKANEMYSAFIDIPGCKNVKDDITFGSESENFEATLDQGITISGRVVTSAINPNNTGVPNLEFGAKISSAGPGGFSGFVGTGTDQNGNFELTGLETGTWQFESFDGGFSGSQKSFVANAGSLGANATYTVDQDGATGLILVMQANKRVNISVNDGVNLVKDAMIDINCDSGKNVHLGHSNDVWTFLPPSDTCRFSVRPKRGGFEQLINYPVSITSGELPQNVTLGVNGFNKAFKSNNLDGWLKATKSTISPGQKITYKGHIQSINGSPLVGTAKITFPESVGSISTITDGGTCQVNAEDYTCVLSGGYGGSVFNFSVEITTNSDYEGEYINSSLYFGDSNIDNVFTDVTSLTLNAPSYVGAGSSFTVFGEATEGSSITLTAAGVSGTLGSTVMDAKSTWYSIPNVSIADDGEYVLTITSEVFGTVTTTTKTIVVGNNTTVSSIVVSNNGNNLPTNSLTGLPSGQVFEGNALDITVVFTDTVTNPIITFMGTSYDMIEGEAPNTWGVSIPSGWTGYGNASLDLTYDLGEDTIGYGTIGEILVLIDPSGYIYDTTTNRRIEGATVNLYQLIDAVTSEVITRITGADLDEDGSVSEAEEGTNSGDAVGMITDCFSIEGTLDTAKCIWSLWDASSSGQENPQTTDAEGRYGWNVPQGWYRVAFQKDNQYSLAYSRDIYVPPAETELNVNLAAYDIAPPTVSSAVPADTSTSVPRNARVVVEFSEPMLDTSINSTNIELLEGISPVEASVSYNSFNYTATITPTSTLSPSTLYTLSISGVKDDSSNTLASDLNYTFTTSTDSDLDAPSSSASPSGDTYSETQSVTLSATDNSQACTNCIIYYTTNGDAPTTDSYVYNSPISITSTTTLKYFAVDMAGNEETANTDTYTLSLSAPDAPTNLDADPMNASVSLNWDDTDNATGYKVYRSSTSGGTYTEITTAQTRPTQSLYTDLSLTNGSIYYYKVSAYNSIGESGLSSYVYATPAAPVVNPPSGGGVVTPGVSGPKVETNTLTGLKVVKEAYAVTNGTITENVTVSTANGEVTVGLLKDVKVTGADGKPFVGQISPPQVVQVNTAAPENRAILGNVYEIGIKDKGITFDKPVTLRFALPSGTKSTDKAFAYYLDEKTNTWTVAGNGGKIMSDGKGGFVLVVEVTHFTKFAAMKEVPVSNIVKTFKDIANHWAKKYIEDIASRGIINGYSDGTYRPDSSITRAELVKIAVKMFGLKVADKITENPFKDVVASEWYGPYVKIALDNNIVKGYDDGTFRPNTYITRAEALKVLLETAKVTLPKTVNSSFTDVINSGWYAPYVEFAVLNGIANGYSKDKFEPAKFITRGEVAKISSLMIEKGLLSKTVSILKDILGA